MAEKILRMISGLFVGIWVARYLGPEQFGLLSYSQSFVFLFSSIATLGLDTVVVKRLLNNENSRDTLLGTSFSLKLAGAILILPVIAVFTQFTNSDNYTNLLILIIASASIFQSFNVIDFYYQSKVLSKYTVYANSISLVITSVIKVLLILNDAPLIFFVLVSVIDAFIVALGLVFFYTKLNRIEISRWKFDLNTAKEMLGESWTLIFSSLIISFYTKIDQIMLKEILNTKVVGEYAAALRLCEVWYFIPVTLANSLFPAIVNAKKINEKLYYSRLLRLYKFVIWIAVAIGLTMTVFSDDIFELLYGQEYIKGSGVLMIYAWAGVFSSFGIVRSKWLINENLQKIGMYYLFCGAVVNVILNMIFIRTMGGEGAAIATLLSLFSIVIIFPLFHKRTKHSVLMFFSAIKFWG